MHSGDVAPLRHRFGDLLDAVAPFLQHDDFDGPPFGLGLHEVVDELLVVGSTGVDEHQLLRSRSAGLGRSQRELLLRRRRPVAAERDCDRRCVDESRNGRGHGHQVVREQPALHHHTGQVRREQ